MTLAIAEAYVQGVSTRKVKNITEKLCGLELSKSQVSRLEKRYLTMGKKEIDTCHFDKVPKSM